MKTAILTLAVLATSIGAQGHPETPEELAGFARMLEQMSTVHVDGPIPPGWELKGDMLVPAGGFAANTLPGSTWPDGIVPYRFDANMSTENIAVVLVAMGTWMSVADVTFIPWSGDVVADPDFVHIRNSDNDDFDGDGTLDPTCSSAVGVAGGMQILNLASSCMTDTTDYQVQHELGHALGFFHEQVRPDRGDYVTILVGNISDSDPDTPENETFYDNFDIQPLADPYGPYDFDSVMHYGQYAFSSNGSPTIEVVDPADATWTDGDPTNGEMGQRDHLSEWDQRVMSYWYAEDDWRFHDEDATPSPPGSPGAGTFEVPWNALVPVENAIAATPDGGKLVLMVGGTHSLTSTISKPIVLEAPLGGVVLD